MKFTKEYYNLLKQKKSRKNNISKKTPHQKYKAMFKEVFKTFLLLF